MLDGVLPVAGTAAEPKFPQIWKLERVDFDPMTKKRAGNLERFHPREVVRDDMTQSSDRNLGSSKFLEISDLVTAKGDSPRGERGQKSRRADPTDHVDRF